MDPGAPARYQKYAKEIGGALGVLENWSGSG
jgi:hypothetical protein